MGGFVGARNPTGDLTWSALGHKGQGRPAHPRLGRHHGKLTVRPSIRGGVPVFSLPARKGRARRRWASAFAGRPPPYPLRAALLRREFSPKEGTRGEHDGGRPESQSQLRHDPRNPVPLQHQIHHVLLEEERPGWFSTNSRIAARYSARSAWARVARRTFPRSMCEIECLPDPRPSHHAPQGVYFEPGGFFQCRRWPGCRTSANGFDALRKQ